MRFAWLILIALLMECLIIDSSPAGEPATGWRGNGTGLWPESTAPIEWSRIAHGAMEGMCSQANCPAKADKENAPAVKKGLIAEWLVLGPLPVADSVKEFDKDLLGGEATAEPTSGDQAAGQAWRKIV